ncbi:hypothetical protein COCC4DRAFT_132718 [Bipolaris maydis ATCC 48331]|uniref:Uncharacterized protein n=2 Tax=Cochliobolus heterostrophus TaxID=5016 RepID=M2UIH6_COCH5|nr:uncharacterized protein COCC4DRAFT_132718 [Bipolaris maydis ATCC 48331]EMD93481.1 hypothetical protein COCHEDRAFT_1131844 [Bipolaris maydis C5]KAH7562408.1 hypothetical protein BM1_01928 [Bipolaris maydis]ENI07071.1 hypothetical protein COCC4DRAFT_132718 [Bipolaris maydis ATCC 48331]KAJ5027798.1 hypothetical protein J3E73DRAFT_229367 [Bipolaris maydis]KAJ5062556.1 hypothetical protein J3E74DRAFT_416473 [Bipolaris maydis]
METSTEHKAYRSAPQPPSQETSEHRVPNNDVQGQSCSLHQSTVIGQLVSIFLANVKSRFGEDSPEVMTIWNVLGAFRAGRESKKDTLITINHALGHHRDLKQDLMKVLYHPEAKWQTGDFELEPHQPMHSPTPSFLQPVHQPQIRLPPILWFENRQTYPSISSGHDRNRPPIVPKLEVNHTKSPSVPCSDIPARPHESLTLQAGPLESVSSETTRIPVLGVPVAVDAGQTVNDMPPPSNKRRREAFEEKALQEATDRASSDTTDHIRLLTADMDQPVAKRQSEKNSKAKHPQAESGSKSYIHSLCGRGFSTRSKVKKHHWGNVLNDLETTTGCWAKHGKPNVSWDEHPSCTEGVRVPGHAKITPAAMGKDEPQAAPHMMASMMPAPDEPPETAARSVDLREHYQEASQGPGLYHSHRPPNRSSFDTLLSAVNAASEIDARNPQGRIDSVVTHIGAQATAVEDTRQYVVNWQNTVWGHDEEAAASGYPHPYTTLQPSMMYPLGGYHVPVEVALPFYGRPQSHTPQMYPCTEGNWIDDQVSMLEGAYSSPAPLEPRCPDPYAGSRPM